ncbi:MAG: hypothetical protein J0L75_08380 [Spirochaetes bacterium]|nr:hypothetical protein [Spirochaetota bacterium]
MKKIALSILIAGFAASCTSIHPVAGATGKVGAKVGEAKCTSVLYMPAVGEAGVANAARAAGISTVGTVDVKVTWWVFGITYTTIVTGE